MWQLLQLLLRDGLRRGGCRVDDRSVGKAGRDRREVVATGAVTTLAADGAVGRLGADPLSPRSRESGVAIQATGNLGPHADRFALEVLGLGRVADGEERPIPALAIGRVVIREPRHAVLIARVTADHRQVAFARTERILDQRAEHGVADARLLPERAVDLLDRVRDLGVGGIGSRAGPGGGAAEAAPRGRNVWVCRLASESRKIAAWHPWQRASPT